MAKEMTKKQDAALSKKADRPQGAAKQTAAASEKKRAARIEKIRKATREIQRTASKVNAALSRSEQEENNRLLALRIEERKAARPDMAVADVIKHGTPEEKAILRLKDFDLERMYKKGFLSLEEQKALHFSYDTPNDKAVFLNYLKLFADLGKYADKLLYVVKMYEVEVALLSKLIDKYEAIGRDMPLYEVLYSSKISTGGSGMGYNLTDNDKTKMKRLEDTTPEALLAEMNDAHKNDGVIIKRNVKGDLQRGTIYDDGNVKIYGNVNLDKSGTLIADIDHEGGLHDQIQEQAKECEKKLSFVKAYIEPIEEYLAENDYYSFAPCLLENAINGIKEQEFSRNIIAKEYHLSYTNDKRSNGEEITALEEYEAVVPDYREVVPDKEVKDSCYIYIKEVRNEQPQI